MNGYIFLWTGGTRIPQEPIPQDFYNLNPPLASMYCPVTQRLSSEARNAVTSAISTEGNDSSFFAACAYADGAVWKTVSGEQNPIKRLEFWNWWLTQAVPAAWSAVEDNSNLDLVLKTCK
ncbi:Imm5 family immunity protein [Dulcicalothrix desertica]|uniref:Imm5 family immunity protein n=1 Tax=Dulcicalothrix desertica TaxID=32056 RepID=UPI000F8D31C0|nr:Imm5 family immunity protein [Dulcicalothrix desertica]